jgi:hypothetical protein
MVSKMKGPAMPAGVGHDGATGELFVKGGMGEQRRAIRKLLYLKVITMQVGSKK